MGSEYLATCTPMGKTSTKSQVVLPLLEASTSVTNKSCSSSRVASSLAWT